MTTKSKEQFIGPKLTKEQRVEALEFWTQLSTPRTTVNDITSLISSTQLSNEDIDKLVSQLKALRTTNHKSGPTTGVGARCKELIKSGLGNKDVLVKIKEEFPLNNTTYSCVAWYRNDMKQKNEI